MYSERITPIDPLEVISCPLCLSPQRDVTLAKKGYPNGTPVRNVICTGCGLIRISPRMSPQDYIRFYRETFFDYLDPYNRPAYVVEMQNTAKEGAPTYFKTKILPYIEPYVPEHGRVLDVGAGFGQLLYLLKKSKSIEGIGLEPDPGSRGVALRDVGIELQDERVEDYLERTSDPLDFVFMEQVFEHLLDPLMVLKKLAQRLTKEGVIYIGVPNSYDPQKSMSLFYELAHTFNYTPYTLNLFAERAGLKIINIRDPKGHPLEVLMARKDSSYPAAPASELIFGNSWREIYFILKRKRILNVLRGGVKRVLGIFLPTETVQRVRTKMDQMLGRFHIFRY